MTSVTWEFSIDLGRTGTYTFYPADSDLTPYVLSAEWSNGMSRGDEEFAPPAQLTLQIAAEWPGILLVQEGLLVRVRATFNTVTHQLFVGKLVGGPMQTVSVYGQKVITLVARDLMGELLDVEFSPELQTNVTTGEALRQPFRYGKVALPYARSFWVLDASQLGTNTVLLGETDMVDFDAGQTTLAYAGDMPGVNTTIRAQQFLRDIVAAEAGGRFWFDARTGKFTFRDRHRDLNPSPEGASLSADDYEDMDYTPASKVINQATVYYQPREIGAAGTVVYEQTAPTRLAPKEVKRLSVRYTDPTLQNARVGAMNFIDPVPGLDYAAVWDGFGQNRTSRLKVHVAWGGTSATITLVNDSTVTLRVTTLRLRATPIFTFEKSSVQSRVAIQSVWDYDYRPVSMNIPMLGDRDLAQSFADWVVVRSREARPMIRSLRFIANKSDARMTAALELTLGTTRAISLPAGIGASPDMPVVVGERHRVQFGGEHTHEVTWIIKSSPYEAWVLGRDLLDVSTVLVF